ncbi:MAG: hypothetical protein J6N78_06940 [Clostridia bacterium]|nr:hypothetical protein [Clostridia bacterium]
MKLDRCSEHEKSKGRPFTDDESKLLNSMFGNCDRIDGFISSSKEEIIKAAQSDNNCYILHENETVDKQPPKDGEETYFGLYICKMGDISYILARPV